MSWDSTQQMRLSVEKGILDRELNSNNVTWFSPTSAGNTRVEWQINTNNGKSYTLRVYIPGNFPNECPKLVVSRSPYGSPLRKWDGSLLDKCSVADHTYAAYDGFTQICHFNPARWSNASTLYQVLMKGRMWLEAYEIHRNSGEDLDTYLPHMK